MISRSNEQFQRAKDKFSMRRIPLLLAQTGSLVTNSDIHDDKTFLYAGDLLSREFDETLCSH